MGLPEPAAPRSGRAERLDTGPSEASAPSAPQASATEAKGAADHSGEAAFTEDGVTFLQDGDRTIALRSEDSMADNAPDFGAGATKPMTSADTVSSRDAAETQPDAAFGTGDPVGPSKADIPGQGRDTAEGLDAPVDVSAAPHEVAPVPSEQHAPAEAPAEELSPADIPLDPVQAPAPEPDAAADDMAAAG